MDNNQDSHALLMLTMLNFKLIDALLLDSVLSVVITLFFGKVKSRPWSLDLPLRLNSVTYGSSGLLF